MCDRSARHTSIEKRVRDVWIPAIHLWSGPGGDCAINTDRTPKKVDEEDNCRRFGLKMKANNITQTKNDARSNAVQQQPIARNSYALAFAQQKKDVCIPVFKALRSLFVVLALFMHVLVFMYLFSVPMVAANGMADVNVAQSVLSQGTAVGFDASTDTVLILGGSDNNRQLLTFKDFVIAQQSNLNLINGGIFGYGQHYTQLNDMLWMLEGEVGKSFIAYNTKTRVVSEPSISIPIAGSLAPFGCLASTQSANGDEHLFVVGGFSNGVFLNTVEIYNLNTGQWMSSTPTMQIGRGQHACIAHQDVLYAIGGYQAGWVTLSSIETLSIGNDLADVSGGWSDFEGGGLSLAVFGCRAVAHDALIFVAGGWGSGTYPTLIHILDTLSKTIAVDTDNALVYGTSLPGAIVADGVWFVFGGNDGGSLATKYQYQTLASPTGAPTRSPSKPPSSPPSSAPTLRPTAAPSGNPSSTPSADPSRSPTAAPSRNPSNAPTHSPTAAPTRSPSIAPSVAPSAFPTTAPTLNPSTAPTQSPTAAPTRSPSTTPSAAPSASPTAAPSISPTAAPSRNPSSAPSSTPSASPTSAPTRSPSVAPSAAPSDSPTAAPTRFPTVENAYDSFIAVDYMLDDVSTENVEQLTEHSVAVMTDMERMIERGYVEQSEIVISYRDFWVQIDSVNDYPVASLDQSLLDATDTIKLPSKISCNEVECNHLMSNRDDDALSTFVTSELRSYLAAAGGTSAATETVTFRVQSTSMALFRPESSSEQSSEQLQADVGNGNNVNVLFYLSLALIIFIGSCAVLALCFNDGVCLRIPKVPGLGCHVVDDGNYRSVFVFALHLLDFLSDINLATEMWINPEMAVNKLLFILGIASVVFIAVPYCVNVYHASKIKQYVEGNECAEMHFERSTAFFAILVVLSGGCYASISLCSSNIFGISMFSAGLTTTELRKLRKIRVSANVLLENIPQIIVQIIYATMVIGHVNSAVVFAFVASVLSVTGTLLHYFLERERGDVMGGGKQVVWYYLVMQMYAHNAGQYSISADQRKAIKANQGRRKALIGALSELFSVLRQNIEIARTDITKYGAIVYVSHVVYASELVLMTESSEEDNNAGEEAEGASKAQTYLSRLYASHRTLVNEVFRTHFAVSHDFHVRQQYKLSAVKKGIWMVNQDEKDIVDAYAEVAVANSRTVELAALEDC